MALNKKMIKKLTKDFILPHAKDLPPSIFDEVTRPDWKPTLPIYFEKRKKRKS